MMQLLIIPECGSCPPSNSMQVQGLNFDGRMGSDCIQQRGSEIAVVGNPLFMRSNFSSICYAFPLMDC